MRVWTKRLACVFLFTLPSLSFADDSSSQNMQAAGQYLKSLATYQAIENFITAPDVGEIIANNVASVMASLTIQQNTTAATSDLVAAVLMAYPPQVNVIRSVMGLLPAADFPTQYSGDNAMKYVQNKKDLLSAQTQGDMNLNVSSLLGPTYYNISPNPQHSLTNAQMNDPAFNFIIYLSSLSNPLPTLDLHTLIVGTSKTVADVEQIQSVLDYRLALRTWTAMQTTALSMLLYYYNERVPVQGLGTTSGIPNFTNASLLQVDEYSAGRRMSPLWYKQMESAPPATIQRELVYLMAELRYEQFKSRLEQERTNTLLAAMLLHTTAEDRAALQELEKSAMSDINPVSSLPPAAGKLVGQQPDLSIQQESPATMQDKQPAGP